MKDKIHPKYVTTRVACACSNTFVTRSTVPELRVDICSQCHPFYTGRLRIMDTEGRVERFQQRYVRYQQQADEAKSKQTKPPAVPRTRRTTTRRAAS